MHHNSSTHFARCLCKAEPPGQSESDTDSSSRPNTSSSSSSWSSIKPVLNSGYELSDVSDSDLYSCLSGVSNISMTSMDEPEVQRLKTAFLEDTVECLDDLFYLSNWQGIKVRIVYLYFLDFPHLLIFSSTEKLTRYYISKKSKPPKGRN